MRTRARAGTCSVCQVRGHPLALTSVGQGGLSLESACPVSALVPAPPSAWGGLGGAMPGFGESSPALQVASPTAQGTPSTPALECGQTGSSLRTAHAHVLLSRPPGQRPACDPRGPWRGQACAGRRDFPPGSACESEGRRGRGRAPRTLSAGTSPAHLQDGAGTTRRPSSSSERGQASPGRGRGRGVTVQGACCTAGLNPYPG